MRDIYSKYYSDKKSSFSADNIRFKSLLPDEVLVRIVSLCGVFIEDNALKIKVPQFVDLYMQGDFPIDRLITIYEFHQIRRAIDDTIEGHVIIPVLRM